MKRRNVYYVENPEHGKMVFYLDNGKQRIYMFELNYFSDVIFSKYSAGRSEREVIGDKDRNPRNMKLRERLLKTTRYLEKYGVAA